MPDITFPCSFVDALKGDLVNGVARIVEVRRGLRDTPHGFKFFGRMMVVYPGGTAFIGIRWYETVRRAYYRCFPDSPR